MKISRNQHRTVILLARERGITLDELYRMCLSVRGRHLEDLSRSGVWNELDQITPDECVRLLADMRAMPVSEAGREEYRRDHEELKRMALRDGRAAARFFEDDPHVQAQREGWGL